MASGLAATPVFLYTNIEYATVVALAATFFVLAAEVLRLTFSIQLPFWSRQLARVRRPDEKMSWASIGFLTTLVVLFWLTPIPVAVAAAGMLAFGDGTSSLVGRAFGRNKISWNPRKTWEGSIGGMVAGFLGAYLLVHWYLSVEGIAYPGPMLLVVLVVGAAFAMFAESLPKYQDNVTVPLFAGLAMLAVWGVLGLDPPLGELFARLGWMPDI